MAEAMEIPFASITLVGPGKHLLHIADRFGRILYCVHSTQYSLLVSNSVIIKWNQLGQKAVDATSINAFTSKLDGFRYTRMGFFMDPSAEP